MTTKPLFNSTTIRAIVIAFIGVLGLLGYSISEDTSDMIVELAIATATTTSLGVAVWGRIKANTKIKL